MPSENIANPSGQHTIKSLGTIPFTNVPPAWSLKIDSAGKATATPNFSRYSCCAFQQNASVEAGTMRSRTGAALYFQRLPKLIHTKTRKEVNRCADAQ
jgi:hypothetical protein